MTCQFLPTGSDDAVLHLWPLRPPRCQIPCRGTLPSIPPVSVLAPAGMIWGDDCLTLPPSSPHISHSVTFPHTHPVGLHTSNIGTNQRSQFPGLRRQNATFPAATANCDFSKSTCQPSVTAYAGLSSQRRRRRPWISVSTGEKKDRKELERCTTTLVNLSVKSQTETF